MRKKWEYKIAECNESDLEGFMIDEWSQFGEEGWELVSVTTTEYVHQDAWITAFFKREIND